MTQFFCVALENASTCYVCARESCEEVIAQHMSDLHVHAAAGMCGATGRPCYTDRTLHITTVGRGARVHRG